MSSRIAWIDAMKGMGILLVIFGHNDISDWLGTTRYIYWFHMPLFFIVSGYLFNSRYDLTGWVKRRTSHLLIPYLAFLVLFIAFASAMVAGSLIDEGDVEEVDAVLDIGRGAPGVWDFITSGFLWWFMSTLFFTQVACFPLLKQGDWKRIPVWISAFLVAATMWSILPGPPMAPFRVDIVLFAAPFYLFGALIGKRARHAPDDGPTRLEIWASAAIVLTVLVLDISGFVHHGLSMKSMYLGVPLLNFIVPVSGFYVLYSVSRAVTKVPLVSAVTCRLGEAAMVLYFLHRILPFAIFTLVSTIAGVDIYHPGLEFVLAVAAPYLAYRVLLRWPLTRRLFIGD